ncbi:MAG: prepilin-type N-terminal cleavage/methylation domain-containing protein [Deltaproteobacteria bacterium]|nr:prepilin-type N-terminal cleavage/methylation domain-containing protein [Deltaproteobacteria bacterium]
MPNAECGINQAKLRTPNYELRTSAIHSPQSMGMTLIEIIMVMVIIGILSVFLIPKFNLDYSSEAALNGAAYLIASDIRYAQEFAMANRVSKTVTFSTNPPGPTVYTFTPTNSFDPSGQLPSGVTIISNFTITFNSLGEPTTGGDGSVTILGGGLTKTVSVVNYTGKVNIL